MFQKSLLNTRLNNGILKVEINRPEQLNALNSQVLRELDEIVDQIISGQDIKAAFIIGSGEKAFVAGADIKELSGLSGDGARKLSQTGHHLFSKIENCPKPIIAAVNGLALGGGLELAMACHFRIASEQARFGQPEINLGIIPGYGGTQRLIRYIGKGKATELMMTGDFINAQEALQLGLVNHLTPKDQLTTKVLELLYKIIAKSSGAISKVIECANAYYQQNGFEVEIDSFAACFDTQDSQEGIQAFIDKRKPEFKGK
ncbi:enoyl-CoA hydratase-related protein [Mangrovibacterium lignilyticum]|uniref:enoyl-CoA hydratase-related protein n=1 Tax=Mangrovibacterium lignilyticum TaxID=2668052 RepID=UPI0013D3C022|nr:enoyl-CoA hydratase-related protein [Mangrovibacterium lignilyticum]